MSGFRKHGRKLTRCAVHLSSDHIGEVFAETRDISETGVFISCQDLLQGLCVGDKLEAKLYSECDHIFHACMRVIRLTEEGVGLAFE